MCAFVAADMKDINRHTVFDLIKSKETTSKIEISKITGISSPTVIKIVNFLMEKDIVIEIGEAQTAIGRRPRMLQINRNCMYVVAFVLEGDFLSMGVVDILGNVIYKENVSVLPDYTHVMDLIKNKLIDQLIEKSGISRNKMIGVGLALPVIFNKEENTISGAPMIGGTKTVSLEADVKELMDKYSAIVMVENDTNAQVVGEFQYTSSKMEDDLLFISAGTGLGAGLIINGKLRRGNRYMCGEIGNTVFDAGFDCRNTNIGWLEHTVGHRRIEKEFKINIINEKNKLTSDQKENIIRYLAEPIALCINNINACLDCRNVVLGGKVIEVLGPELLDEINSCLSGICKYPLVVRKESSEDVGLKGIAWLLFNKKIKEILAENDE